MKKLKNLKMLLVAAGLMGSLSFFNCYAMERNENSNSQKKEIKILSDDNIFKVEKADERNKININIQAQIDFLKDENNKLKYENNKLKDEYENYFITNQAKQNSLEEENRKLKTKIAKLEEKIEQLMKGAKEKKEKNEKERVKKKYIRKGFIY